MNDIKTLAPMLLIVALAAAGAAAIVIPVANGIRSDIQTIQTNMNGHVRAIQASVEKLEEPVQDNQVRTALHAYVINHALEHSAGPSIAVTPGQELGKTEEPG